MIINGKTTNSLILLVLAVFLFLPLQKVSATSVTKYVGTGSDDSAVGTNAWTSPTNIQANDTASASAGQSHAGASTYYSHYLKGLMNGNVFAVPAGATINGIVVQIERINDNDTPQGDASTYDEVVSLVKGGTVSGDNKKNAGAWVRGDSTSAGAYETITYGGAADLWSLSLTSTDVNATNFGAVLEAKLTSGAGGGNNAPRVDFVSITVYYTVASNVAPNAPTLVSPANASKTSDNTPTLSANYSDNDAGDVGTTNYRITSGTAQNCLDNANIVASGASSETASNNQNTTFTPGSSIGSSATYYWCAQNNDGVLTSSWTSMGNFILDTTTPDIVAVDAGASSGDHTSLTSNTWFKYTDTGSDDQISFSWTDPSSLSDDTFYYELNASSGSTVTGDESTTTNPYIDSITITEGTNYFHVRPQNGAGTWGTERTFIVKYDKSTPDIVAVDAGASSADRISLTSNAWFKYTDTGSDDQLSFSWTDPSSASDDTFYYELNTTATNTVDGTESNAATPYIDSITISEGTSYFHVRPKNGAGTFGTERIFIIKYDKTAPTTTANGNGYTFGTWTTGSVTVTLSCSDGTGSGCGAIKYCTDTLNSCTPGTTYSGNVTVSTAGTSYIRYFSTDAVANNETAKSSTININTVPTIDTPPSDGSSSVSTPTVAGNNVTFTETAIDPEANNYYMAICKTDAITAHNNAAPTCASVPNTWCISGSTASGAGATCNYTTSSSDAGSHAWYAFLCDYNAASLCTVSSQGSGDTGSPFVVELADAYWVGGTGNWSDATNHWAAATNGTPGAGNFPGPATNVHFDTNSGSAGTQVTIDSASVTVVNLDESSANVELKTSTNGITVTGDLSVGGTISGATAIVLSGSAKTIYGSGTISAPQTISTNRTIDSSANITLSGAVNINSGITLTNNGTATVTANFGYSGDNGTWAQGSNSTLNFAGGSLDSAGQATLTAAAAGNTVNYNNAGSQELFAITYNNLTISGSGTKLLGGTTTVNGNLTISAGTLDGGNFTLNVAGNWSNAGIFTAGGSTVTLNGTNQKIFGATTFYNLTKDISAGSAAYLYFQQSNTQAIAANGTLTLKGGASSTLTLRGCDAGGTLTAGNPKWGLNVSSTNTTLSIDYVDVKDSDASAGKTITHTNTTNSGNTLNWGFGSATFNQEHYKIYQDDSTINAATQFAAEDTNYNVPISTNFRIRFETANTGTVAGNITRRLEFKEDGGAWTQITTGTNNVRLVNSANFADTDATTQRLTPVGTFAAGQGKDTGSDAAQISLTNAYNVEDEYSLKFEAAALTHIYQFRISNAGVALDAYSRVPTIAPGSDVIFNQKHFKIYQDNAALNSATQYAPEDNSYNVALSTNFRIRFEVANTGTVAGNITRRLEFKEDGGSWTQITTGTNNIRLVNSTNFADTDATTQRLTPVGTFAAGQGKDTGSDAAQISLTNAYNVEDEYSLKFEAGASGHSYQFRITNAGSALNSYTVTPIINAGVISALKIKTGLRIQGGLKIK